MAKLKDGTAWAVNGPDLFLAIDAAAAPAVIVDDAAGPAMEQITGTSLWFGLVHIEPLGKLHQFHYQVNGAAFGGSLDVPAFGPLSDLQPGRSSAGTLSEKLIRHQQNLRWDEE